MADDVPEILTGFNCIADENSKILILGSMPGAISIKQQQYYAHPRNAFWKIMEALYGIPMENEYETRIDLLKQNGVALWDVVHQCVRPGSLDANIQSSSVQVNDFKALFEFSPCISKVYFNGGKSAELYKKKVLKTVVDAEKSLQYAQLPSTSPANARLSFLQKLNEWQKITG